MPWKRISTPSDKDLRELRVAYRGKVRLLVDENAGPEVAEFLRGGGFNVKYVGEFGLCGHPDEDVFAVAWREKRVLVTHDEDFLNDQRFPPNRNPGVIRIGPGADGRDQEGLRKCLFVGTAIGEDIGTWYVGKKIDFTSRDFFTVCESDGTKTRFSWPDKGHILQWED